MMRWLVALVLVCLAGPAPARTLIVNANGIAVTPELAVERFAMLLVGDDGRVEARLPAGAREPRLGPGDHRLDARGATLLPGLVEAHGHLLGLGTRLRQLDLAGAVSLDEALARVAAAPARGPWILGGGWNQESWRQGFPTAADLDRASGARPAWLTRTDGHAGWANSAALAAAGITAATPDPSGGRIVRDAAGRLTGILVDKAMELVERHLPAPSGQEREQALAAAFAHLLALGITSFHDMGTSPADWTLLRAAGDEGRLPLRVVVYAWGMEGLDALAPVRLPPPLYADRLKLAGVKLMADGALGSRGAALHQPYADAPAEAGLLLVEETALGNALSRAAFMGAAAAVHAIGDRANSLVLDAFERIGDTYGRTLRHRLEHAQVLRPQDLPRVGALGLVASVQPIHAPSDRAMAEARLGAARLTGAYAWASLAAGGARLALGTDVPVEPADPFANFHAAVTHADGWRPTEALPRATALAGQTSVAHWAAGMDDRLGTLAPGQWADFVLLDGDPLAAGEAELAAIRVRETWVAGRRSFVAGGR